MYVYMYVCNVWHHYLGELTQLALLGELTQLALLGELTQLAVWNVWCRVEISKHGYSNNAFLTHLITSIERRQMVGKQPAFTTPAWQHITLMESCHSLKDYYPSLY